MRNLLKNTQPVYFKNYMGKQEIVDEYGNVTGSYVSQYGDLMCCMMCVSPNKGFAESELFGSLESYDRTMTTADRDCPIDEDSILWLDERSTETTHNYIVKKRAPWKNSIAYAIEKVTLRE